MSISPVRIAAAISLSLSSIVEVFVGVRWAGPFRALILACVKNNLALHRPERNLTYAHAGVDPQGLNTVELEGPLVVGANVDEIGRDMDEKAEPCEGRSTSDHGDVKIAAHYLHCVA